MWANLGQYEKASAEFTQTLKLDHRNLTALKNRAYCWEKIDNRARAVEDYELAMKIDPADAQLCRNLAQLLVSAGASEIDPKKVAVLSLNLCESKVWKPGSDDVELVRNLVVALKSAESKVYDDKTAIRLRSRLCELTGWASLHDLNELSTAYARAGDFATAVKWASKAVELCRLRLRSPFIRRFSTFIGIRRVPRKSLDAI